METVINRLVLFIEHDGRKTYKNHKHAIQLVSDGKGFIEGQEVKQADEKPKSKHLKNKKEK